MEFGKDEKEIDGRSLAIVVVEGLLVVVDI